MKSPSPPPAPDPVATAQAQGAANRETALAQAELNMVNQTDPFGNKLVYNPIGKSEAGNPRYEAVQTLSPEQQALAAKAQQLYGTGLTTAQNLFGQLQGTLGTAAPQYNEDYRKQQLDALLARQNPQIERDRAALETQLANQGIGLGSEAYNTAMQQFNQRLNDLRLGADVQAGNEARAAYQTMLGGRASGINELTGLMNLGQVQTPQFAQTPQTGIASPDVIGATYGAYNANLNRYNSMQGASPLGALAGLGGAALGGWAMGGFPGLGGGGSNIGMYNGGTGSAGGFRIGGV